jgi:opacity protein-like surface antigen
MNRVAFVAVAGLLGLVVSANAQVKQGGQDVGIEVGVGIPVSQVNAGGTGYTLGKTGFAFGASYDYMLTNNISVGGDISDRVYGDDATGLGNFTVGGHDVTILATGKYQLMPDKNIRPYGLIGLGVGLESLTASANSVTATDTGTGFAWALGVGAAHDVNPQWAVNGELRFTETSASLSNNSGNQNMDSVDVLVSAHFKIGS